MGLSDQDWYREEFNRREQHAVKVQPSRYTSEEVTLSEPRASFNSIKLR
jgi:hypothetical protein